MYNLFDQNVLKILDKTKKSRFVSSILEINFQGLISSSYAPNVGNVT